MVKLLDKFEVPYDEIMGIKPDAVAFIRRQRSAFRGMGQNRLVIVIPTKTAPNYLERKRICEATWLRIAGRPVSFSSDADLGLDENYLEVRPRSEPKEWFGMPLTTATTSFFELDPPRPSLPFSFTAACLRLRGTRLHGLL